MNILLLFKGRPRDSFVIGTKSYLPRDENTGLYKETATEQSFLSQLNISLKRLGLDYVDILYHHHVWKRESALYEPVLKALEKAKKEGKVRHAGITTHRNEPEVIEAALDSKFYEVVQIAYNHRQRHAPKIREALARAGSAGLGVVTMKTFGGGGNSLSKTEARAALKWVLQDPNVHTIIPGITTFDQLELDLSVMEGAKYGPRGRGRVPRILGKRLGRSLRFTIPTANGARLAVDPENWETDTAIVQNGGVWDPHVTRTCRIRLRPGEVFYDVGSNAGLMTVEVGSAFRYAVRIVAFEPQRSLAMATARSAALNGLRNVSVHRLMLGSEEATGRLFLTSHSIHASSVSREPPATVLEIPQVTLDAFVERPPSG